MKKCIDRKACDPGCPTVAIDAFGQPYDGCARYRLKTVAEIEGRVRKNDATTLRVEEDETMALRVVPYDAVGHAPTCDRVEPVRLAAYVNDVDNTCSHCGEIITVPSLAAENVRKKIAALTDDEVVKLWSRLQGL